MSQEILIVDDSAANVDILYAALADDYEIRIATSGEAALESIAKKCPDLVLLDIMMAGMDGYEVCRRLKASESTRTIPVMFITALSDTEAEARGLALGAVDFITKPFNTELVKARVKNHIELKLLRNQLENLVEERTRELSLIHEAMIDSIAKIGEFHDGAIGGLSFRTLADVKALADELRTCSKSR